MAVEILLPKLGFSVNEAVLVEWMVPDGATVKKDIAGTSAEFWVQVNPVYYPEMAQRHVKGIRAV